jgi:hypothetical protein
MSRRTALKQFAIIARIGRTLCLAITGIVACSISPPATAAPPEKVVRPKSAAGPLNNPLKGWCPFTDAGRITLPYSMVFFPVAWNELEPQDGKYAFEEWERRMWDIDPARGKHVVFRIYADMPNRPSGFPNWLRDQGVKLAPYTDYGGGQSPDYNDPRVVKALERFIAALGKRYDEHPRLAFLQLGLLGFWGEWHTYPRNELFASPQTQQRVIDSYRKAFPNKSLMARTPGDYAGKQPWLGFHDDLFPEDTDGPEGWKFLPRMRESKRTENWKLAVIGGEMDPNQARKWLGPEYDRTTKMTDATHFTWIGPYCPALEQQPDRQLTDRAATLVRRMGYQFTIQEVRHPASIGKDDKLTFSLAGENQGVAPFYYPWQVELAMLDNQGKLVEKLPLDWDVRKWLPGKFKAQAAPLVTAMPGSYQLALGIRDPWTDLPAIAFANELPRRDGWTILSRIDVR